MNRSKSYAANTASTVVRRQTHRRFPVDRVIAKLKIAPVEMHPTLGMIRTTSANLVRKEFGLELQTLFLGNSLNDVASVHYTTSHDDYRLDDPLQWLAGQYGIQSN